MKILQVINVSIYGGLSLHALSVSRELRDRGHQVKVVSMLDGPLSPEFEKAGLQYELVNFSGAAARRNPMVIARAYSGMKHAIESFRPDIMHTHGPRAHFFAGRAGKAVGSPVHVASIHGSYRQFTVGGASERSSLSSWVRRRQFGAVDRYIGRIADRLIAVSEATARELIQDLGVPENKVSVIHNGIEEIVVDHGDAETLRRDFAGGDDRKLVAYVGSISAHKGTHVLLEAAALVLSGRSDTSFLIIGAGPLEDELAHRAIGLGLGDSVIFTGSREDAVALMAASDMVVLPSFSEGLSLTLLEAAMMGKAIVATDVGGNQEIVKEGKTGLLTEPGDVKGFARTINSLLDDEACRLRMGAAARKLWEEEYTAPLMVDRFESLYRELLESRTSS